MGRSYQVSWSALERQSRAQLYLPPGCGGLGDGSKLLCVHEPVGSPQIRVIQCIEELAAELEPHAFRNPKVARQRQIQSLQPRTVNGVAPNVTEGIRRRSCKCCGIEPLCGTVRPRPKNRRSGIVGANGILTQRCAGIGGISEYRDGQWEPRLNLIHRRELPVFGCRARPSELV